MHPTSHSFLTALWDDTGIGYLYSSVLRSTIASQAYSWEALPLAQSSVSFTGLTGLCCEAVGGSREQAAKAATAWNLLWMAAHLLDDVEDATATDHAEASSRERGSTINVATGLIISAGWALNQVNDPQVGTQLRDDFYRTVLKMCAGQQADLTLSEPTLEQCWQKAEAKSGLFFALACRSGGRLASANEAQIDQLSEYGLQIGILVQIWNDFSGLWPDKKGCSDLTAGGSWTLPVAYAMSVIPDGERSNLRQWLDAALKDRNAENNARRRIIESGAMLYLTVEAQRRQQKAEQALVTAVSPSRARGELLAFLRQLAAPPLMQAIVSADEPPQSAPME